MEFSVFIVGAALILTGGIGVVASKNPVHSALFLIQTLMGVAVLFVLQGAHFLAAVQIIVYAGAIMVLFLFVVMMLNLRDPETVEGKTSVWQKFGVIVGIGMGLVLLAYLGASPGPSIPAVSASPEVYALGGARFLGKSLFTDFILPFEVAGVLLLAAVIGAVALAKKNRA